MNIPAKRPVKRSPTANLLHILRATKNRRTKKQAKKSRIPPRLFTSGRF